MLVVQEAGDKKEKMNETPDEEFCSSSIINNERSA